MTGDPTTRWRWPRLALLGLALALAIGVAARFTRLELRSFWLDEAFSVQVASQPLGELLQGKVADAHTPPLYYVLLHGWLVLGGSDAWIRGLSGLWSLVALGGLAWGLSSSPLPSAVRRLALAAVAISPFQIYFAQEARMYTLATALALAVFFLEDAASRGGRLPVHLALAALGALGLYCHYYLAFVIAGSLLWRGWRLVRGSRSADRWRALLLPHAAMGLLFLPWMGVVYDLASSPGQTFRTHGWAVPGYAVFRFLFGYGVMPHGVALRSNPLGTVLASWPWVLLGATLIAVASWGLMRRWQRADEPGQRVLTHAATVVATTFLLPWLISLAVPMYSERYLGLVQPLVVLLLATGICAWPRPLSTAGAAALLASSLLASGLWLGGIGGKEQWRQVAERLIADARAGETVVVDPGYTQVALGRYLQRPDLVVVPATATGEVGLPHCSDGVLVPGPRVWVILSHAERQPLDYAARLTPCSTLAWRRETTDGVGVVLLRFDSQPGVETTPRHRSGTIRPGGP